MYINKTTGLPTFYNYNEEGKVDEGYEALQDFFLSWTIRCSHKYFMTDENKFLNLYARRIVFALIHGENSGDGMDYILDRAIPDDFIIKDVTTKRQWNNIDLLVDLKTIENGEENNYILNIENKWYSKLNNPLEKYKEKVKKKYQTEPINLVILCDNNHWDKKNFQKCYKHNYKLLSIKKLKEIAIEKPGDINNPTKNELFDQYWFKQNKQIS
jgi:hypothetical protein